MKPAISAAAMLAIAACAAEPPANPMERHARLAMAGELVAQQCAGFAGGYDSARRIREDANKNMVAARNLGATNADLERQRTVVRQAFMGAMTFTSQEEACNQMIGELAWATG